MGNVIASLESTPRMSGIGETTITNVIASLESTPHMSVVTRSGHIMTIVMTTGKKKLMDKDDVGLRRGTPKIIHVMREATVQKNGLKNTKDKINLDVSPESYMKLSGRVFKFSI